MTHRRRSTFPEVSQDTMRCVVDGGGDLVFVSPSVGWLLGQDAAALMGKPVHTIMQIVSTETSRAETSGNVMNSGFYDLALLREDRDPVVLPARVDWVRAEGGKPYTVIWIDPEGTLKKNKKNDYHKAAADFAGFINQNQKDWRRTAAAKSHDVKPLLNEEGELRHFLNLSSDLLGVYKNDLSFVRTNPSFNWVLGFSDAELKVLPFADLIHPEEKDVILQVMQKIVHAPADEEVRVAFECRTRCKDGSFRWVEWQQKAVGGHVYVVGRDVTDIKRHEEELSRREQQLSEAQKIGRMGHWYLDVGQNVMEWSDQIYAIFGVEKASFTPSVEAIGARLSKRDFGRISRLFQRALIKKKDYEFEFSLRRASGGLRYVRCEGRCKINSRTGKVEALIGIMQDITERTLHERALHEAKEAAESAYASKTRFLANMSHELRTPLNAIIGFSEMMQRQLLGPVGNTRYLDYINSIRTSGEHLLDLINDILDMSKIEVGKYELYVEELNIGKVIRLAIHMVEGRAHESQVRLMADDLPDDVHIMADRRALMQVLLNILSNAVKFTRSGGLVDIRCFRELGGVAIVVSDTGIGIPKDKLDIVTLPFEQAESEFTRNHEGSGLGLAITKDLVELHGGTLDIDSEVGIGTIVTVLLPDKIPETATAKTEEKGGTFLPRKQVSGQ